MHVLALDLGTTSVRAIAFDGEGRAAAQAARPLPIRYPRDGWVEQDAEDWWTAALAVCREAMAAVGGGVAALGITNQRETVVVWERASGRPIAPAIVWQDRRTAERCRRLREDGIEDLVRERTGLLLDPYFSATKIAWLLDEIAGARAAAERGELACGTVDSFLLWRLSGGRLHATDATNASRTMLFDLARQDWDDELLRLARVPRALLPEVRDSSGDYGLAEALGGVRIAAVCGDQQAALVGQACVREGLAKSTYGTGCFALVHTGRRIARSRHRLLTTVACRIGGVATYALEGAIFNAGSTIQWLRDRLGVIASAADSERLAASLADNAGVYLVPAFTGLGAPHWDPEARGAIVGLGRDSGPAHLARAALEAVCWQTRELLDAFAADSAPVAALRVDGGMAANDWMLQFLADACGLPVARPRSVETTAWGAAWLAGIHVGAYPGFDRGDDLYRAERSFAPRPDPRLEGWYAGWRAAVARVRLKPA
jgi:glycerol kinase